MASVEKTFTLARDPAYAVCVRLTPDIKAALLAAHAAGQQLSLQLIGGEAGPPVEAALGIGDEQHSFSLSAQNHHDLMQLPGPGRDAQVLATVQHKLQPKRTLLDGKTAGRVRAAGEEAARRKQEGAAVKLPKQAGPPRQTAGPTARTTTVQRQATPPPRASTPPLASRPTPTAPLPAPSPGAPAPPRPVSAPAGAAPAPPPAAQKKVLQPPKPASMKPMAGSKGTAAPPRGSTSPPHQSPPGEALAPGPPSTSAPAAPPPPPAPAPAPAPVEVSPVAILAAVKGNLQLVLVALMAGQAKGMSNMAVVRGVELAYRAAKSKLEAKEYIQRMINTNTERAPPGNRLVLKPEVYEQHIQKLRDLAQEAAAGPSAPPPARSAPAAARPSAPPPPRTSPDAPQAEQPQGGGDTAAIRAKPATTAKQKKKRPLPPSAPSPSGSMGSAADLPTASQAGSPLVPAGAAARPAKKPRPAKLGPAAAAAAGSAAAGPAGAPAAAAGGEAPAPGAAAPGRLGPDGVRLPPLSKAVKAARHVKGISDWDEDDRDVHGYGWGPGGGPVDGVQMPVGGWGSGDMDWNADGWEVQDGEGEEAEEVEGSEEWEEEGEGGDDQEIVWGPAPTGVLAPAPPPLHGGVLAPPPPPPTYGVLGAGPPVPPPPPRISAPGGPQRAPPIPPAKAAWPPVARAPTPPPPPPQRPSPALSPAPHPEPSPQQSGPESGAPSQADDELWAAVQVVEDPPSEAAEYAEFLQSPLPSPAPLAHADVGALVSLEEQYTRYHALQFKVKQKYNQAMVELRALDQAATLASEAGQEDVAARRRRELWAKGAGYYLAINTWRRVLRGLQGWMDAARRVAEAAVGAGGEGGRRTGAGAAGSIMGVRTGGWARGVRGRGRWR